MRNLPGWMSIKSPSEQTRWREGGERESAGEHCSFCQGQMARAALEAARPLCLSGRGAHTTRRRNYLGLFGQQWSKQRATRLIPSFDFFFFFSQSVAGIEGEFVRRSNQISCLSGFDQRLFTRPGRSAQAALAANTEEKKVAKILILNASNGATRLSQSLLTNLFI